MKIVSRNAKTNVLGFLTSSSIFERSTVSHKVKPVNNPTSNFIAKN